jgi:MFS family permease
MSLLAAVCLLTFLHYVGAQMRGPILPLYAAAHGATATGVGFIVAAHMAVAAAGSIPLGRASDVWGRRPLLLGGMVVTAVTSLLLPLFEGELALITVYGLAGLGVAAFTPSALSLVTDGAAPGRGGYAFAWYTTAHYGAIAVDPFLGGLAAEWWGYRQAFVGSAIVVAVALVLGLALPAPAAPTTMHRQHAAFADIRGNTDVWAGWIVSVGGLTTQGVVFTFFPLLADGRGLTPAAIGLVFLVLGLANTLARFPAGWLVDRTGRCAPYAVGGVLVASAVTALLPGATGHTTVLALAAVFGAVSGTAGVATGVALAGSAPPASRGIVMGGYSTALYLGLALGSFALGPVITHRGYSAGFSAGGAAGMVGALIAALLWAKGAPRRSRPAVT